MARRQRGLRTGRGRRDDTGSTTAVLTDPTQRQISPQIAAAWLTTPRPDLTAGNAQIVDALEAGRPRYAVMRSLMMAFGRTGGWAACGRAALP